MATAETTNDAALNGLGAYLVLLLIYLYVLLVKRVLTTCVSAMTSIIPLTQSVMQLLLLTTILITATYMLAHAGVMVLLLFSSLRRRRCRLKQGNLERWPLGRFRHLDDTINRHARLIKIIDLFNNYARRIPCTYYDEQVNRIPHLDIKIILNKYLFLSSLITLMLSYMLPISGIFYLFCLVLIQIIHLSFGNPVLEPPLIWKNLQKIRSKIYKIFSLKYFYTTRTENRNGNL